MVAPPARGMPPCDRDLAFREQHDERAALSVADGVQLGVEAAFDTPDTTGNSPFLSRLAAVRSVFRSVVSDTPSWLR